MRLVSPLLKNVMYPALSKIGYFHRRFAVPVVLTYHGVFPAGYECIDPHIDGNLVSVDALRQQLNFLRSHYNVVSPERFLRWIKHGEPLPEGAVLLTCDDGLQNCLTEIVPVLREFELSCIFFVTGASLTSSRSILWHDELYLLFLAAPNTLNFVILGKERSAENLSQKRHLWWRLVQEFSAFNCQERASLLEAIRSRLSVSRSWFSEYLKRAQQRRFSLMNSAEIAQLVGSGMCIGAHTMSHPVLSHCNRSLARNEILECKQKLEALLCQPIWALAYPFGDQQSVTPREVELAEEAGFASAFVNSEGLLMDASCFALPRVHVTGDMCLSELQAHISGVHRGLREFLA